MKQLFLITIFLASITAVTAQSDFNYSFFPVPTYKKLTIKNEFDSLTNGLLPKRDSSFQGASIFVEKENGNLAIRNLQNLSESFYEAKVRFVGIDNNARMTYQALTPERETVYVNPMIGLVVVEFQQCFEEPQKGRPDLIKKHCNIVRHIFGMQPPATPPAKPK